MSKPILFFGDTSLQTAASYLAGCLADAGWEFDYVPSEQLAVESDFQNTSKHQNTKNQQARKLIILSDYPAENMAESLQQRIIEQVHQGTGLLMIGGWESFQGADGNWAGTPIGNFLPVEISEEDDRQNCDQPVFIRSKVEHPITNNLPWNRSPPLIGGYNKVRAKERTTVLLEAEKYEASFSESGNEKTCQMKYVGSDPLLVVDETKPGCITTLMTDLAPHWVGPLVDWGANRVAAHAPDAGAVEVGNHYAQFVQQLIRWCGRLDTQN